MNKLSVLFYPFLTKSDFGILKTAAVFFDEIYIMTPISLVDDSNFSQYYKGLSESLMREFGPDMGFSYASPEVLQHESVNSTIEIQRLTKELVSEGIVSIVNPFDELKSLGYTNEFRRIIKHRSREAKEGKFPLGTPQFSCAVHVESVHKHSSKLDTLLLLEARTSAIKSVMYDSALYLCSKRNLLPITTNYSFDREFSSQAITGRILPFSEKNRHVGYFDNVFIKDKERIAFETARHSILHNIPNFDNITFKEITKVRHDLLDELISFRIAIQKLSTKIEQSASENIEKEIDNIVRVDINPVIDELKRKLKLSKSNWSKRIFDKITSLNAMAALASTVFVGMPFEYSLLVSLGISGLQAAVDGEAAKREIKQSNGVSFLLDLQNRLCR